MQAMKSYLTPEEYLARERVAEQKSEYLAGQVYAMSGASRWHSAIATNLIAMLANGLRRKGCSVYGSDMRVKVNALGKYTYPDLSIACGEQKFDDQQQDTLLNPTVIVEILSKSTEHYDRGKKFDHYRALESLREYLLVSQDEPLIQKFVRAEDETWIFSEASGLGEGIRLSSVGCELSLADIYVGIEFPS
jgi:Uma2 family endonuclease